MDKQITLLEGQSSSIVVKPTFEGKPAADKVELSQSLSNADILQLTSAPVASENNTVATVAVKVGGVADLTGNLVYKYTGNESEVENVGISTKQIGIKVNPAQLATQAAPSPVKFKFTPGAQLVINVLYKNGDQNLKNDDTHLTLSVSDGVLEFVSRSDTGVTLKIKDDADASAAPSAAQSLVAAYYSGSLNTDLTLVPKPSLTIQTTPVSLANGGTHAFPVSVTKAVAGGPPDDVEVTNIQATADEYFTVDATGKITVVKADTAEVDRTIHYTFDYTEDDLTWTYSADVALTIAATETPDQFSLSDVSTPLTMDLWAKQTLSYKVMDGETDVTSSVTSVTVSNADAIKDKFEVTQDGVTTTFQSVSSSSTDQVTATANVVIAGTYNGQQFSLSADVNLVTNVNDGSIPTNRFDVQMDQ